jgi:malate synthase
MVKIIEVGGLKVDERLVRLVRDEIAPGTGVDPNTFWTSFEEIVKDLAPKNRHLLEKRDALQKKIDAWHLARKGKPIDGKEYREFLTTIGYLEPEGEGFQVTTANVDPEIAEVSGPQLVAPRGETYNPARGTRVVAQTEAFLDEVVGLEQGKFSDVTQYSLKHVGTTKQLIATLNDGRQVGLADRSKFVGFVGKDQNISSVLLKNNGLHIEIQIDRTHPVGKAHPAAVKDVLLEAAITTIEDCEDAVAAVDAADKTNVYSSWNGIMKGTLEATFEKSGRTMTRRLNPDKTFTTPDGKTLTLPGRSMLLVRNVGIHMYTDAVTTEDGDEVPEGFLDAMVTTLAAMHDLKGNGKYTNSKTGSIYIVKPKLHGPEEVKATVELFQRVEAALGLGRNTLKIGIMDEERRTTVNLKKAIRMAKERVVFINTGFLDRTGDEIHTCMEAGPMLPKAETKIHAWINAYEDWNVDIGIETGLIGKAQIGKGMWTMPDKMREMVDTKIAHPEAGASTAWVITYSRHTSCLALS